MSNIVTVNSGSAINGSLKAGRISISTDSSVTPSSGGKTWYNMINPAGGYTIISDPKIQGYNDGPPIIYPTQTTLPSDILATINGLPDRRGSVAFDNVWDALIWVQSTGKYFILDKTLSGRVSDGIALAIDFSQPSSYPQSGSTAFDLSGNDIDGTLINGPTFDSGGWIEFDGIDDSLNFSNAYSEVDFPHNSAWSIQFKANAKSFVNSYPGFLVKGAASSTGVLLFYGSNGVLYWKHNNAQTGFTTLTFDKWVDITLTYGGSGNVLAYINGVYDQTVGSMTSTDTTSDLYLGRGDQYGDNLISSFKKYSKQLSSTEVSQNYYGAPIVTDNLAYKWDAGNLVSYDKSGTTTYNLAGSISGSLENGVAFNNPNGGTWEFDGSNDRIVLESSITPGNGNWTVTAWVKGKGAIVGNTSGGPIANSFGISNAGNITYYNYDGAWQSHVGNTTLSRSEWYMLTWVNYAGATAQDGTMKMYVNGVADSSIFNSYTTNGGPFNDIGHSVYLPNGSTYFDGEIANVQVNTGTAFTDAQVVAQYNAEYPRFKSSRDIPKEGLKIHYDLTDPNCYLSGTTVYDLSGNGNNGAVSNGAYFNPLRNGSIDMDGTDDYIITNFSGNTSTTSYTVINVMKSDNNSSDVNNRQSIFGFDDGDGIGYNVLCQEIWGQGGYGFVGDGSNYTIWSWTASGAKENIQVYGCVRTPTQVKTYVNGALTTTYNNSNRVSAFTRYTIGERGPSGGNNWDGQVFYSLVYDRELSADEINRIYNTINARFAVALPRTVTDSLKLNLDAGDTTSYSRTGTTWYDRSGNGNNATLYNSPTYTIAEGGVFDLDGTDDYFIAPASAAGMYNFGTDGTLEMWFRPDASYTTNHRLLCVTNNASAIDVYIASSGILYLHGNQAYATQTVPINEWTHLMVTYVGGVVQIYFNGEAQTMAGTKLTGYNITNNNQLFIGQFSGGGSYYFNGKIANTKIYHRGLTPSEVLENYKSTRSRFGTDGIVTSGLVFNVDAGNIDSYQNSSTTTTSLTGSHTGTLTNGVGFESTNGGTWDFDGTDDYISMGSLNLQQSWTLEVWVNMDSDASFGLFGQGTYGTGLGLHILYQSSSRGMIFGMYANDNDYQNNYRPSPATGAWYHWVFTYNVSTYDKQFYADSVLQTPGSSVETVYSGTGQFNIGAIYSNAGSPANGKIAVSRFYNRVLTATEVEQNYNALKNRFGLD